MKAFGAWFFKLLFGWLFSKAETAVKSEIAGQQAESTGKKNEEVLNETLPSGDLNEIGKAGGNLLNGTRPK